MKTLFELTDIGLTIEQKKILSERLEKLMVKYEGMHRSLGEDDEYFSGVADGLNHAWKMINVISDDYLSA